MSEYDGFRLERDDARGVATITLDVPGKLNRVSMAERDQLARLFGELGADAAVRVVVLTGAGEAFTAGGDIAGFLEVDALHLSGLAWNVAAAERCPKPVIAKLRGYAFGVGLELALACDFRLAADDLQLGLPEIKLGMIPGSGGTQRLARLVGAARAKDLIYSGRFCGAEESRSIGLADQVHPAGEVYAKAVEAAARYAKGPGLALRAAKQAIDGGLDVGIDAGLLLERHAFQSLFATEDTAEGMRSFQERGPGKAEFKSR